MKNKKGLGRVAALSTVSALMFASYFGMNFKIKALEKRNEEILDNFYKTNQEYNEYYDYNLSILDQKFRDGLVDEDWYNLERSALLERRMTKGNIMVFGRTEEKAEFFLNNSKIVDCKNLRYPALACGGVGIVALGLQLKHMQDENVREEEPETEISK